MKKAIWCVMLASCAVAQTDVDAPPPVFEAQGAVERQPRYLEHGLTAAELRVFEQDSFGSKLLPLDWAEAFEAPDSREPFFGERHLRSLGLWKGIGQPRVEVDERYLTPFDLTGTHVGFNCATCHTGEIHYRGQTLLVAGGAGLVDVQRFVETLTKSAEQTLANDDGKLDRFAARVTTANRWRLQLKAALSVFALTGRNFMPAEPSLREGFGRSDTVSKGITAMKALDLRNHVPITAPASVPPIWATSELESFHVSGGLSQRLGRDIAAGIGGGIGLTLFGSERFRSNIDLEKLSELDEILRHLSAPAWPEDVLGEIDVERAQAGATVYVRHCAQCHEGVSDDGELLQVETPLEEIGTDPSAAERLGAKAYGYLIGIGGLGGVTAATFFQELTTGVAERAMDDRGLSEAERQRLTHGEPNVWTAKQSYKASLLSGIWATAPYLHNGSVRSLRDLLLPPEQRPQTYRFCADTEYDPGAVGLADEHRAECFLFDTRLAGNRATGHDYGTTLSADDRDALLEYLRLR